LSSNFFKLMLRKSFFITIILFCAYTVFGKATQFTLSETWSKEQKVDSLCSWVWQYRTIDSRLAVTYAEEAVSLSLSAGDKGLICKSFFHQGSAFFNAGKLQLALESYNKALEYADARTPIQLKARIHNGIGLTSVDLADYSKALEHYNKALQLYKMDNNQEGIALQLQNIGVVYYMVGRTEDALNNYLESVKILEMLPDARPNILANNLLNTAIVFMEINELQKALEYYHKAVNIYAENNDMLGLAHVYSNMGVLYFRTNLDSSLYYHQLALEFYSTLSKEISIATSMNFVADIYREKGEYEKALAMYKEALDIIESEGYVYGQVTGLNSLGILYRLQGNFSASLTALHQSFELAESIDALNLQIMAAKELWNTYEQMGDYHQAFSYLKIHKTLNDSLFNLERLTTIKSLEFSFETEKKEREIEKLLNEKRIIRARMVSLIVLALLTVVFMLVIINRQRLIRRKEKLFAATQKQLTEEKLKAAESELALRKKLLLNYALRFTEKNNLLSDIQSKLKEMNVADKKHINTIASSIRMNLLLPGERQELETLIDQAGADFFCKIENISDNLTETEKRVCVFLSFGFNSKDISGIMNITSGTIDNYRSAIRKKLNIPEDIALQDFLSKL